jgi:GNAT superfamily N-acetyltransferase
MYKLHKEIKDTMILLSINEPRYKKCSILKAYTNDEDMSVIITGLHTFEGYRGKGYATVLLNWLFDEVKSKGYKTINVDDFTDLFRKPNNIYLLNGFKYIEEGYPEMIKHLQ